MSRLSLRNNRLKLETSGELPIAWGEFMEYTGGYQHATGWTCKHWDLNRLCPNICPDTDPEGEETGAPCVPTGSWHSFSGGYSPKLCVTLNTMTMYRWIWLSTWWPNRETNPPQAESFPRIRRVVGDLVATNRSRHGPWWLLSRDCHWVPNQ